MAVALYAFRANNNPTVYYLAGDKRYRVRAATEQAEMGIATSDVRVLQPTHPLLQIPLENPAP